MTGLGINEAALLNCSAIIKNIIAEQGLLAGWPLIKQQFANCHLAYQALETEREKQERQKRQRRRQGQQRQCLSKKNQDRCDCVSNFGDCVPDLPCDGLTCSLLKFRPIKKSIQSKSHNTNKYDIKESK